MNVICGINSVLEALAAGTRSFDRLLIMKGTRNRRVSEAITLASQLGVPLRFETRETLDRMAGELPHQGIIALVSAKPVIGLDELLDQARDPGLLVALDGVEDPRNLGAVLRTVDAAGAHGVILPERHSAGLSETVARTSAGGLEHVKVARVGNLVQALEQVKNKGYWIVGFDASGTDRWDAVDYKRPIVLVLGGEDRGIRRLVREHCDHLVSLPLFGHVNSLNVSVAAGIALYEVVRQRGATPSHVRPIPARGRANDVEGTRSSAWSMAAERDVDAAEDPDTPSNVFLPEEDVNWPQAPVILPDREKRRRKQEKMRGRDRGAGGDRGGSGGERPRRKKRERPEGAPSGEPQAAAPRAERPERVDRERGERPEREARPPGEGGPPRERGDQGDRLRKRRRRRGARPAGAGGERPAGSGSERPAGGGERPEGGRPAPDRPIASPRPQGPPREPRPEGPAGENAGNRGVDGRPRRRRRRRRPPQA